MTDELIWKDCVDYKFRWGGSTRPPLFKTPWPILVQKAKNIGIELLALAQPPSSNSLFENSAQECNFRTDKLLQLIHVMESLPMSKALLEQSDLGKALHTFIKECRRINKSSTHKEEAPNYFPNVWTLHHKDLEYINEQDKIPTSPLDSMQRCLLGWREVAAWKDGCEGIPPTMADGSQQDTMAVRNYTGRSKNTTLEQHQKDLKRIQSCTQWRHLYVLLTERMNDIMTQHGQRMRQLREEKDLDRPKVSLVAIRTTPKMEKQEAILSGAMSIRKRSKSSSSSSSSSTLPSMNKLQQLRKEAAVVARMHIRPSDTPTTAAVKIASGGFGASVARVAKKLDRSGGIKNGVMNNNPAKKSQTITLDHGKRMTIPNKSWKGDESNKKARFK
jgi:hypothetical protein